MPKRPVLFGDVKVISTPLNGSLRLAGIMELSGFDTRVPDQRVRVIERAAAKYIGPLSLSKGADLWAGLRPLTPDGLPVLDRLDPYENVHTATGHGMIGMVLGPASGKWMSQYIVEGVRPAVLEPFKSSRFTALRRAIAERFLRRDREGLRRPG